MYEANVQYILNEVFNFDIKILDDDDDYDDLDDDRRYYERLS